MFEEADKDFEKHGVAERRRALLAPLSGSVLEIGSGIGSTWKSGAFDDASRFRRIVMTEPDVNLRTRLQQKITEATDENNQCNTSHIEVVDAGLPNLPFKNNEFDVVCIFYVLSHVSDKKKGIDEMVRVLKPGGRLLLMDHGLHYHDHSGKIVEHVNGPPPTFESKPAETSEPRKESSNSKNTAGKGGEKIVHFDSPPSKVVDLFKENISMKLKQELYEEFQAWMEKHGIIPSVQAVFKKK